MSDFDDLKKALKIDRNDLDTIVMRQPQLFFQVAEEHVQAVSTRDAIEQRIKELTAELDAAIRRKADKADEKITEPAVKQKILSDDQMKQLQGELIEAVKEANLWYALRQAFEQRMDALKLLARNQESMNYQSNSISRERSDAKDRMAERNKAELSERRNRRD